MATGKYLTALGAFGNGPSMFILHMGKGLWGAQAMEIVKRGVWNVYEFLASFALLCEVEGVFSECRLIPLWLQGSAPWYEGHRSLHEVLSWNSLLIGYLGIWARMLSTLFWIACHRGWCSRWSSASSVRLHSCLVATPPKLGNYWRGSSSLVPPLL